MYCRYDSPIGPLWIAEENGAVTQITNKPLSGECGESAVLRQAVSELTEYFFGMRKAFTVPVAPKGTEFQLKVWAALRNIPYGETRSYGEIAAAVGNPKASRAVGCANNKNPILILTPCHRIIGANGALTGFAAGLPVKEALLQLEKEHK